MADLASCAVINNGENTMKIAMAKIVMGKQSSRPIKDLGMVIWQKQIERGTKQM
jgi:hypothetical protein